MRNQSRRSLFQHAASTCRLTREKSSSSTAPPSRRTCMVLRTRPSGPVDMVPDTTAMSRRARALHSAPRRFARSMPRSSIFVRPGGASSLESSTVKGAPAASRNSLTRVASSSASDVPVSDSIAGGNERSVQYGARGEEGATTLLRTPGGSRATVGDARSSAAVSREATSGGETRVRTQFWYERCACRPTRICRRVMRVRRSPYVTPVSSEDHRGGTASRGANLPAFLLGDRGVAEGFLRHPPSDGSPAACARVDREIRWSPSAAPRGCVHICIVLGATTRAKDCRDSRHRTRKKRRVAEISSGARQREGSPRASLTRANSL